MTKVTTKKKLAVLGNGFLAGIIVEAYNKGLLEEYELTGILGRTKAVSYTHLNIVHMHFIDGTPYGHLIWGDGNHNLKNWLETVNKNGYTGLLSQEITASDYYQKPFEADCRNFKMFEPYM